MEPGFSLVSISFHFLPNNNWFGLDCEEAEKKKLNYEVQVYSKESTYLAKHKAKENYSSQLQSMLKFGNQSFFNSMKKSFLTLKPQPSIPTYQFAFFNQFSAQWCLRTLNFIKKMK